MLSGAKMMLLRLNHPLGLAPVTMVMTPLVVTSTRNWSSCPFAVKMRRFVGQQPSGSWARRSQVEPLSTMASMKRRPFFMFIVASPKASPQVTQPFLSGIFRSPEVSLAKAMPAKLSQPFAGVAPSLTCFTVPSDSTSIRWITPAPLLAPKISVCMGQHSTGRYVMACPQLRPHTKPSKMQRPSATAYVGPGQPPPEVQPEATGRADCAVASVVKMMPLKLTQPYSAPPSIYEIAPAGVTSKRVTLS
mmetsp:Transcript_74577/g.164682  ORF Transcript_74577/g.164682 Transcript_74577/m.164682 type:complete len:247 (-) Transcript_74577:2067-2807(-)